jgi:hypothetical protein
MPVILATQEAEISRIEVQASPGKEFLRPYLKNNQHKKRVGGVAQVVEWLPSKCKALSSIPVLPKKVSSITLTINTTGHSASSGAFSGLCLGRSKHMEIVPNLLACML